MAEGKLKPEKKVTPTRAPQKKTSAGIFDNMRQPQSHPVEDLLASLTESTISEIAIAESDIAKFSIAKFTIPDSTIVKTNTGRAGRGKVKAPKATAAELVPAINPGRGFLQIFNDIVDMVFPALPPSEQSVLLRLYRESRGRKRDTVTAGYGRIGAWCNMSRSAAQAAVATLLEAGFIEKQGDSFEGSTYRVNLPGVPPKGIVESTIPESGISNLSMVEKGVPLLESNTVLDSTIPDSTHMKIKSKEHEINTHTGAGVASRFNLEECKRYAEHLKATGQGITNPGGYATKIFRSGEADALIDAYLNPVMPLDANLCPDCQGRGFAHIDPNDFDRGVRPCKHPRLR